MKINEKCRSRINDTMDIRYNAAFCCYFSSSSFILSRFRLIYFDVEITYSLCTSSVFIMLINCARSTFAIAAFNV